MTVKNTMVAAFVSLIAVLAVMTIITQKSYSESTDLYELKINRTYQSYDITGDYKADKLSVTAKVKSDLISGFSINIDGKVAFTKYNPSVVEESPAEQFYPTIYYIKLESGQPLLYIHLTSANGYYAGGWVYKYESGGMRELLQTEDLINRLYEDCPPEQDWSRPYEWLDSVSGNSLIIDVGWTDNPNNHINYKCKYQNGTFVVSIINNSEDRDSDGDGISDMWEQKGADIDGDGRIDLKLNKMGADPKVPDVFVEVDWMVQPEAKVAWITTREKKSLAPDAESMKKVYSAFKQNGVNLHIDAGPNSVDYVTGKKWGNLSGGNEIAYKDVFKLGENYKSWDNMVLNNFSSNRSKVFHHCTFLNQFHIDGLDKTTSGISHGIPGQYFIVANQQWVRDAGEYAIAGTFMHELGHNLGLCHGGFDKDGNADYYTTHKPNHLSVMNYLYQTSGLSCADTFRNYRLDYSQVNLPDLNENYLIERNGIDPFKATIGFPYDAKVQYKTKLGSIKTKEVSPSYGTAIDFNNSGSIDSEPVVADINHDGEKTILRETTPEWPMINYNGGEISVDSEKETTGTNGEDYSSELTVKEALKHDVLADKGTGALEALGPFNLVAETKNQRIYIRVKNMGSEDTNFILKIAKSAVTDADSQDLTIPGSVETIEYVDIPVEIKAIRAGSYTIKVILQHSGKDNIVLNIPITLDTPLKEDIAELKKELSKTPQKDLEVNVVKELETISTRFDTEKLPQPMAVRTEKKTVKAKQIRKRAKTIRPIKVNNAQGKLRYKVSGGSVKARKALKLNKKSGQITVKKKTKRGTYKIKVKVTAAGTTAYKAGSKTVTVAVKVK